MSDGLSSDRSPSVFRHYLRALWRRAWIVVAVTAIVLGVGIFQSKRIDPLYQAQGRVEVASAGTSSAGTDVDLQAQIWIVQSPAVHEAARRATPGIGRVTARQAGPGNVIAVSATSADPKRPARAVNATIDAYVAYVHKKTDDRAASAAAAASIQAKLTLLQNQIDAANANSPPAGSALAAARDALIARQSALQQQLDAIQFGITQFDNTGAGASVHVVARAIPSTHSIRAKPQFDGLHALGVGLLLGLVVALFVEFLVRSRDDEAGEAAARPVAAETGERPELAQGATGDVTLMGVLPTGSPSVSEVVSLSAPDSDAAQSYRSLHDAVSFMGLERGRCIEVTSVPDRDGKTEIVANLAVLLVRTGRRVIVVDCDLRKPRVHEFFGLANETGFTSVMAGSPLDQALQPVPGIDHLYALTSGPLPHDPEAMLGSELCGDILGSLLVRGTMVIVDAPPVLPLTDACTLAKAAPVDAVVLVANARAEVREHLREALDALHQSGAPQVGVVLTTGEVGEQPVETARRRPRMRLTRSARSARSETSRVRWEPSARPSAPSPMSSTAVRGGRVPTENGDQPRQ